MLMILGQLPSNDHVFTDHRTEDITYSRCEVIHIAIVCAGHDNLRSVVTLLKSILFYRNNPLHLHFVSDNKARTVLNTLFKTWNIPAVKVSVHSSEEAKKLITWRSDEATETTDELLKTTLPSLLPHDVGQVIVLDPDMVVLADIVVLWKQFVTMSWDKHAAVGLIESTPDHEIQANALPHSWARKLKTHVILFDLERLRQFNWLGDVNRELSDAGLRVETANGILQTMIGRRQSLLHSLPSQWSVSLDEHYTENGNQISDVKIVHMHPSMEQSASSEHAEYFRQLYAAHEELNGNLLRRGLPQCGLSKPSQQNDQVDSLPTQDECYIFRRERRLLRRTHLFYFDFNYTSSENDVTLVTQFSIDRLYNLEPLCKKWEGPMSVALYMSDSETHEFVRYALSSSVLTSRKNIGFHVVFKEGEFYPTNYLRNVAMQQAVTPYIFVTDADFLPTPSLHGYLRRFLSSSPTVIHTKKAYVVPAFESVSLSAKDPENKNDVISMLDKGALLPARKHVWPHGHGATNISRWRSANHTYKVEWEMFYEPYIVVSRDVVEFDERFVGYALDKSSHIMELYAQGYEFWVLPGIFMVHTVHAPSIDRTRYHSNESLRKCVEKLKYEFVDKLARKYNVTIRLNV